MNKEAYCNYETSKLLKKQGFNWPCNSRWYQRTLDGKPEVWYQTVPEDFNRGGLRNNVSRPTHQMAMRWLREERGIDIIPQIIELRTKCYRCEISDDVISFNAGMPNPSYEEAVETAIVAVATCFDNLPLDE